MVLKDISFPAPKENILFDEVLFQLAEKNRAGEFLRFWESPQPFIVLGRIGKSGQDIHLKAAVADQIPILRRTSGGGTVVQGPGCLNFTLVLAKGRHPDLNDLRKSYAWICAKVIEALRPLGVDAVFRPTSDIALAATEKKFSGNAQHRGKHFILHHGTILYGFNLDLIGRYLTTPKAVPAYRQGRSHADFVLNIPVTSAGFKASLCRVMGISCASHPPGPAELSLLNEFLRAYSSSF